ncbi:MAG: hypothetical protein LBS18_07940 [Clostridiales bacterium]|nr:hypothetical protein [Clostridiales bacterium]
MAAALVLLSQLDVLMPGLTLWKLVLGVFLVAITIEGIMRIEFFTILMPIAVIMILFRDQLGVRAITPWPVLGAAALASIGLHILFRNALRPFRTRQAQKRGVNCNDHFHDHDESFYETQETFTQNTIDSSTSFSNSIKYLRAPNLNRARFSCSFCSLKVYFDGAKLSENGADVYIDCSFSGVKLYIPHGWNVIENVQASMGGMKMSENRPPEDAPNLRLSGTVSFGAIEVIYV